MAPIIALRCVRGGGGGWSSHPSLDKKKKNLGFFRPLDPKTFFWGGGQRGWWCTIDTPTPCQDKNNQNILRKGEMWRSTPPPPPRSSSFSGLVRHRLWHACNVNPPPPPEKILRIYATDCTSFFTLTSVSLYLIAALFVCLSVCVKIMW